jgi:hypothetical protein
MVLAQRLLLMAGGAGILPVITAGARGMVAEIGQVRENGAPSMGVVGWLVVPVNVRSDNRGA